MNTFFAIMFSILNMGTDVSIVNTAHYNSVQVSVNDFKYYLSLMASGKKGDPLQAMFVTADANHWKQSEVYIAKGFVVDVTKTENVAKSYRAYRLTAKGVSHLK